MPRTIPEITLSGETAADLLLCAFRYALGRRSYIVSTIAGHLRTHWHVLPQPWQELVHREIREAIAEELAGDACDVSSWQEVLSLPIKP